ncbi:MAG: 50S ribosome-binding GTPase, partial [Methanosarcinaceae archaeon]|nr:50S ribosome-binding GTPase [Methanosarcinaceae archaeon]
MPGYKRIAKDVINKSDILLEVIDARFPDETRNIEVENYMVLSRKPFIIVLNKCDLVSKKTLEKSKSSLFKIAPTVFVSSKNRSGTTMLRHMILETANIKGREILVGSLGYPNTGKSSVINAVTGRHKASTSSISGHTKGVQIINAGSRIKFIDTPGVIPVDEHDEYMQGLLAVKDATHIKDPIGLSLKIIEKMCAGNKIALESFYNITIKGQNSYDVLDLIGRQS